MFQLSGRYTQRDGPRLSVGIIRGRELAEPPEKIQRFEGLLDTGATNSCISSEVVRRLQLEPIGKRSIHTAAGESVVNNYSVSVVVFLENDRLQFCVNM